MNTVNLFFLAFKKSVRMLRTLPVTPFCLSLKIRSSCQTLSKALEMARKTALTSDPSSSDWFISCAIDKSWFRQASPVLNPDWFDDIRSLLMKNSNRNNILIARKPFHKLEVTKQVCSFLFFYLLPFLWMRPTFAFYHSLGNTPFSIKDLNIIWRSLIIDSPLILTMKILIIPWSWALLGSRFWTIFKISFPLKSTGEIEFCFVFENEEGNLPEFCILEHWPAKKKWKCSD